MAFKHSLRRTLLIGDPYYMLRRDAYKIPSRLQAVGRLNGIVPVPATDELVDAMRVPELAKPADCNCTDWLFGRRGDFFEYLPMGDPWVVTEYVSICTAHDLQHWHDCGRYQNIDTMLSDFRFAYGDAIQSDELGTGEAGTIDSTDLRVAGFAHGLPGFPFMFTTHKPGGLHCVVSAIMEGRNATGLHLRVASHASDFSGK
jgi:hypothetical protein